MANSPKAVEVRLPVPNVTLTPYQEFKIAKAQPGEPWVVLEDTALNAEVTQRRRWTASRSSRPWSSPTSADRAGRTDATCDTSITCTGDPCRGLIGQRRPPSPSPPTTARRPRTASIPSTASGLASGAVSPGQPMDPAGSCAHCDHWRLLTRTLNPRCDDTRSSSASAEDAG